MIFREVLQKTTSNTKIQNMINNLERQLKHEKLANKSKQFKIKEMEAKACGEKG